MRDAPQARQHDSWDSARTTGVERTMEVPVRFVAAVILFLLMIDVAGCTPERRTSQAAEVRDSLGVRIVDLPAVAQAPQLQVAVDESFRSPPDVEYGRIAGLDANGDVVAVLDPLAASVTVLTTAGTVRSQFGDAGGGPGEFDQRGLDGVVVAGESVLVPDVVNQQITRFDLDGHVLEIVPLPATGGLAADFTRHPAEGYVYRVTNESGDRLVWRGPERTDTIYRFREPVDPPSTLMAAKPLWAFTPDGDLWVGYTDRLEATRIELDDGGPSVIARRDEGSAEVTEDELGHLRALLEESLDRRAGGTLTSEMREQMLASVRLPSVRPRMAQLLVGPRGTVWLNRVGPIQSMGEEVLRVAGAEGLGSNEWEVLDSEGGLLGIATLPSGFTPMVFVDSLLYGVQTDSLDVETVRRVRVLLD